jgi:hypothetical protein
MKKISIFLISIIVLVGNSDIAQQVDRDMVVLEIVTGTWCGYCPGAAMGAEDLVANGKNVAVIEYHDMDEYTNPYGVTRKAYYGILGLPTAEFDGTIEEIGGSHDESLYPIYLPIYEQRIAVPSPFTIDIEGTNSGLSEYEINITVTKVATVGSTDLTLHLVLTESEIPEEWQNQDELNYVERSMCPDQYGTALDFSSNDVNEVTLNFTMDPSWVNEHCEVVAFVQDNSTKEILQGSKKGLMEFGSSNTNDATVLSVYCPSAACKNSLSPKVEVANYGSDDLTSLDIIYTINGEGASMYQWTGNLAYFEKETVELPGFDFEILENNIFTVSTDNPNGQEDGRPENDTLITEITKALEVTNTVALALKLDGSPGETSWEIKNMTGEMLYSGSGYATPGQFVYETFDLPQTGCYTFVIYDQGSNGLTSNGLWNLIYDNTNIIAHGKDFGSQSEAQFSIVQTGVDEPDNLANMVIYPNPANNTAYVSFDLQGLENIKLGIYNSLGESVYSISPKNLTNGNHTLEINTSQFAEGIYYVNLNFGGKNHREKIIVMRRP